jgi:hypothetical protein
MPQPPVTPVPEGAPQQAPAHALDAAPEPDPAAAKEPIAGLSVLKGLILYGAVLSFAGLYIYFIVKIFAAGKGAPNLDSALVTAAAALAGVLGSAFALQVGTSTDVTDTNAELLSAKTDHTKSNFLTVIRQVLSLEPSDVNSPSWPKTFGIWVYAFIGTAVAITFVCRQSETPGTIKALAVAFGGYVITLVTTAYGIKGKSG